MCIIDITYYVSKGREYFSPDFTRIIKQLSMPARVSEQDKGVARALARLRKVVYNKRE